MVNCLDNNIFGGRFNVFFKIIFEDVTGTPAGGIPFQALEISLD